MYFEISQNIFAIRWANKMQVELVPQIKIGKILGAKKPVDNPPIFVDNMWITCW